MFWGANYLDIESGHFAVVKWLGRVRGESRWMRGILLLLPVLSLWQVGVVLEML